LLPACGPAEEPKIDPRDTADSLASIDTAARDADGDGWWAQDGDCDDNDATVNPEAEELCDGIDNDCDGEIDEGFGAYYYNDEDGDGYGDLATGTWFTCEQPANVVSDATDCDDTHAAINPAATEVCDGVDNDCDGEVDEEQSAGTWYADADGDGLGDGSTAVTSCDPIDGWVTTAGDCDDTDAGVQSCTSCQDILDRGLSAGDGVYSIDPCGGAAFDAWCDMSTDGGGWTLAGWQAADATTSLGLSVRNAPGDADWSVDLACVEYSEIMVFNWTFGEVEQQYEGPGTWSETAINLVLGDIGTAFKHGTYGPTDSLIVMGCVDYSYSGGLYPEYACDSDWESGVRGHLADYAGEYCGDRLDYTWAWSDGSACTHRGEAYDWGYALRGHDTSGGNGVGD
jgi:hypothetical protein